jgi:hypothetical protein
MLNRINISPWLFAAGGLAAIIIALVTISFQAIKAAIANPCEEFEKRVGACVKTKRFYGFLRKAAFFKKVSNKLVFMFRNYCTIAWRNLLRNKTFSFINIMGLAVGMAFTIIIGLWIQYQFSFDDFQVKKSRIALLERHGMNNSEKITRVSTALPLYNELQSRLPEVKRVTRMSWLNEHSLIAGDKKLNKKGVYVDPDFLKMFTFPLLTGNVEKALADPNSLVLTETLAKTLFGSTNPVGKMVKFDNQHILMVSAVAKDVPVNSSVSFDFLVPFEFMVQTEDWVKRSLTQWDNNSSMTVVEIKEGTSMEALSRNLKPLLKEKNPGGIDILFPHPMEKWNLYDEYKDWVNTGGKDRLRSLVRYHRGFRIADCLHQFHESYYRPIWKTCTRSRYS